MIRKATLQDIDGITAIYDAIHTREEAGLGCTCWVRNVYPTRRTAMNALAADDLYVLTHEETPVACGRINHEQVDCYRQGRWQYERPDEQVLVLHTLVVDPRAGGKGYGSQFLQFYEDMAKASGCVCRLDTNAKNTAAHSFYLKHGYTKAGTAACNFNGIDGVTLILLEKKV